jgi:hypothetical protein
LLVDKLPFTIYDFFGYLASGFVLLAGVAAAFVGYEPFQDNPNVAISLLLVIVAYIVGHVVANVAGDVIERRIVRARLGTPTGILLGAEPEGRLARRLLVGYSTPLPISVQERVVQRAAREGVADRAEGLFFHCHATMKSDATVFARLDTFLNLYGFCRNMAMALVLAAAALALGLALGTAETGPDAAPGWWIVAALLAAVGLFYRYLKFLRQFAVELLTSYAERP